MNFLKKSLSLPLILTKAHKFVVRAWSSNKLPLEESNIEDRGKRVHERKQKDL